MPDPMPETPPPMTPAAASKAAPELVFHHIGVATRGIDRELPALEKLGYVVQGERFHDPLQRVNGLFLAAPGQPTLELLENSGEAGPLDYWLDHGVKFYHFAYETDDIEESLREKLNQRAKIVTPLTKACRFSRICFLMMPNMMLIELVQR